MQSHLLLRATLWGPSTLRFSSSPYNAWCGTYSIACHSVMTRTNSGNSASLNNDCICTGENPFAYIYPDRFNTIYLCCPFWCSPPTICSPAISNSSSGLWHPVVHQRSTSTES